MTRYVLVVAALLLTGQANVAVAAEEDKPQHSKNAVKVLATLDMLGINNKEIRDMLTAVDSRIEKGYLNLAEEQVMGGRLLLHYKLSGKQGIKQLELMYTPKDSNAEVRASTRGVMFNYKLKF
jgi:hypothetical protein